MELQEKNKNNKELWIQLRLGTTRIPGSIKDGSIARVALPASSQQLRRILLEQLNLDKILQDDHSSRFVCKLRDPDGALVILSNQLIATTNDPSRPFTLEVVEIHQNVKAADWALPPLHKENVEDRIQRLNDRVDGLEFKMDRLSTNYADRLDQELQSLVTQTAVLKRILKEMGTGL